MAVEYSGMDFDLDKLMLAKQLGAEVVNLSAGEDAVAAAQIFSRGRGWMPYDHGFDNEQ